VKAHVAPLSREVLVVLELLALGARVRQGVGALRLAAARVLDLSFSVLVPSLWTLATSGAPSRADERTCSWIALRPLR
jgi:hypothetical protein